MTILRQSKSLSRLFYTEQDPPSVNLIPKPKLTRSSSFKSFLSLKKPKSSTKLAGVKRTSNDEFNYEHISNNYCTPNFQDEYISRVIYGESPTHSFESFLTDESFQTSSVIEKYQANIDTYYSITRHDRDIENSKHEGEEEKEPDDYTYNQFSNYNDTLTKHRVINQTNKRLFPRIYDDCRRKISLIWSECDSVHPTVRSKTRYNNNNPFEADTEYSHRLLYTSVPDTKQLDYVTSAAELFKKRLTMNQLQDMNQAVDNKTIDTNSHIDIITTTKLTPIPQQSKQSQYQQDHIIVNSNDRNISNSRKSESQNIKPSHTTTQKPFNIFFSLFSRKIFKY
ncbi:uncharacterized protein RJT21DRAFT_5412 [Scheffersomyces amazonensis]|uniref:uncharacterized protein n=1 Tax=Scheffersomyces amazonensis TaxID=1078765 RepID=UPI00315CF21B